MTTHHKYQGLNEEQVAKSRQQHGANRLTPPPRPSLLKLYFEKFEDPLIRILLIAAFISLGISLVDNDFLETIGIFLAIFLATGIAFWFENDARRKFDILNLVNDDILYKVIRNGNVTEVMRKELVVGDVVILNTGEEVPADGLLLESVSLQIDESSLTGEPLAYKTTVREHFPDEPTYPPDEIKRGTVIQDGHCIFRVTQVGDATEYGKVARNASITNGGEIPLNRQLNHLADFIGVVGFWFATLTFLVLFFKDLMAGRFTGVQWGSAGIVVFVIVMLTYKIWRPFIQKTFALLGIEDAFNGFSRHLQKRKRLFWVFFAVVVIALSVLGYRYFGINPLDPGSWISRSVAVKILHHFMIAVTIIVVAVPEGLPMSVTLSLALNMRRMLKNNNLVRKMHAIETIGAVTVICTDKTGTLTRNRMQVYDTLFPAMPDGFKPESRAGELISDGIAMNSTAYLDLTDPAHIKTLGNPTEAALLLWLHHHGLDYMHLRNSGGIINQLAFSTERKYMATLVKSRDAEEKLLFVKGAPEILFEKCRMVLTDKGLQPIALYLNHFEETLTKYHGQAMRTLALAYETVTDEMPRIQNGVMMNENLVLLGICAVSDPVREEAATAVQQCMDAGITIKIVTGDTAGTACEIGRQIGIWKENEDSTSIITGAEFSGMAHEEAIERARRLKIMCRARPSDKQRLVELLREGGCVVAVTGDGTNDAPALNHAHVGLAMGSGTAVAKEAGAVTLMDDSFYSIARAVMWGRSLYRNIQRFIVFQLTINLAAMLIVFLGSVFGHEIPLTVTQMLWVNLIMDTFAAAALASLPPDEKVMKDKPRRNNAFIITPLMRSDILGTGLLNVVVLLGLYLVFLLYGRGLSPAELTAFFNVFVMLQFWNLFNVKSFGTNRSAFAKLGQSTGFLLVAAVIFIGQFVIIEFGGDMFRTKGGLSFWQWMATVGATSSILLFGELKRYIRRQQESQAGEKARFA